MTCCPCWQKCLKPPETVVQMVQIHYNHPSLEKWNLHHCQRQYLGIFSMVWLFLQVTPVHLERVYCALACNLLLRAHCCLFWQQKSFWKALLTCAHESLLQIQMGRKRLKKVEGLRCFQHLCGSRHLYLFNEKEFKGNLTLLPQYRGQMYLRSQDSGKDYVFQVERHVSIQRHENLGVVPFHAMRARLSLMASN